MGYPPWGHKESDMTEATRHSDGRSKESSARAFSLSVGGVTSSHGSIFQASCPLSFSLLLFSNSSYIASFLSELHLLFLLFLLILLFSFFPFIFPLSFLVFYIPFIHLLD